ncbi:MAG: efflux RND transporter periplasmic adaptor subunit [Proteobacteria bacterium]|jgi:multidrug efflux system membrane fusion protein|nr:efflux RND transporter periplasmic adaptor subunit [Pseudomonadota bacterium]MBK8958401.1 efflux RND transporter periplasmic adaptor subunit [Pseudomonadota bacterium]
MRACLGPWPALAFCLALGACSAPPPPVSGPRPVVVEAPRPLRGPADGDALPGAIHARTEADLSFRVAGKVAARKVDMGAHVERGTLLAVLDPVDARLNLAAARSTVAAAEADLSLARAEEQRYRDLRARAFVGQSQLDQRINLTRLAEARLDQAQSQFDLAANQSRYTQLTADAAGVVTQIMAEPGNVVSAGQPVLRFAADGEREVHVNVPEGRIDVLREADNIAVEVLSNPGRHYRGRVRDIDPQADTATRTHLARVTLIDADEHVQLGATATVLLSAAAEAHSFRLPATALGSIEANRPAVWRIRDAGKGTTVEAVPVEVLRYLDGEVLISGPLSEQDRLVSAGVHRLAAGMAVQAIPRSDKAAL